MPVPDFGVWDAEMFPDRAAHVRITQQATATGTMKPIKTALANSVPCSVQEQGAMDGPAQLAAIQSKVSTMIYYPVDPLLTANDQIQIANPDRTYVVVDQNDQAGYGIAWAVQCRRVGT